MVYQPGHSGNPCGRPRGHGVSFYIAQYLEEKLPDGITKAQAIARKLVDMAIDEKLSPKDFLMFAAEIIDRREGKATNVNLNADIAANPFDGIPTEKIEALKAKLAAITDKA